MLTVKQVAARLSISASSVYLLIENGRLAYHRLGVHRGAIRVSEEDLATYLSECREMQAGKPDASPPPSRRKLKHIRL